jgi:hypothetical protein
MRIRIHGRCLPIMLVVMVVVADLGVPARGDEPALAEDAPPAAEAAAPEPRRSQEELMGDRGFLRHSGSWRTAQEIELLEQRDRATLARKEWKPKLDRLVKRLERPAEADRAAEEIREIADPTAVPALAAALAKESRRQVRGWYVEALGRIRSPEAFTTLVAVALDHADPETRIAAVERLARIDARAAAVPLAAALRSSDNSQVNRAAEALGRLRVQATVPVLVDALQTVHVVAAGGDDGPGRVSTTFSSAGDSGLSMGGNGPKAAKVAARNERVLEALVTLTGQNFGYDVAAWKAWLASREAPPPGFDLRRG